MKFFNWSLALLLVSIFNCFWYGYSKPTNQFSKAEDDSVFYFIQSADSFFRGRLYYHSLSNYKKALTAEEKKYPPRMRNIASCLLGCGETYMKMGDYNQAEIYFKKILTYDPGLMDNLDQAKAIRAVGRIRAKQGDPVDARHNFEQAIAVFEEYHDTVQTALAMMDLAFVQYAGGDSLLSDAQMQKAYRVLEVFNDSISLQTGSFNYGLLLNNMKRYDEALHYLDRSLLLSKSHGSFADYLEVKQIMSLVYLQSKQCAKALELFQELLPFFQDHGYTDLVTQYKFYMGLAFYDLHRSSESLDYLIEASPIFQTRMLSQFKDVYITLVTSLVKMYEDSVQIAAENGDSLKIADMLLRVADGNVCTNINDKTMEQYYQCANIYRRFGKPGKYAIVSSKIVDQYRAQRKYIEALRELNVLYEFHYERNDSLGMAATLSGIAESYDDQQKPLDAITYYEKAILLFRLLRETKFLAMLYSNLANDFILLGNYDQAIQHSEAELELFRDLNDSVGIANAYALKGRIYASWGRYDEALSNSRSSLEKYSALGIRSDIARVMMNLAWAYSQVDKIDSAKYQLETAKSIYAEIGDSIGVMNALLNLGTLYIQMRDSANAINFLLQAEVLSKKFGNDKSIAALKNIEGNVFLSQGHYQEALDKFKDVYTEANNSNNKLVMIMAIHNIGLSYLYLNDFKMASTVLAQGVEQIEILRQSATGDIRRDLIDAHMNSYRLLSYSLLHSGWYKEAGMALELAKARYLSDLLDQTIKQSLADSIVYRHLFDDSTATLNFSSLDWFVPVVFLLKKSQLNVFEMPLDSNLTNLGEKCSKKLSFQKAFNRSVLRERNAILPRTGNTDSSVNNIIFYYRLLLMKVLDDPEQSIIAEKLYHYLIAPLENELKGIKRLIIIPDGILNFLPFETLIMSDGRYLVEKYEVKYVQATTIARTLERRHYDKKRKSIRAFGGAIYSPGTYQAEVQIKDNDIDYIRKQTLASLDRGNSMQEVYQMRYGRFGNLPGSLKEVEGIKTEFKDGVVDTGSNVNEAAIKRLSAQGILKRYKVLHFSTHGIVDPEIPELSALVLSLPKDSTVKEDGYLTMKEISSLHLNADFVNLSACNTGLGRFYSGEGVVGLAHTFFVAGANAVSVSIWSVQDQSTMEFMVGMYKLVNDKGYSYSGAITQMKRAFIAGYFGDEYRNPYYWAPFLYYGK